MSGLLVKDIQIVLKQKLLLLLAVVFGVGFGVTNNDPTFVMGYIALICVSVMVTTVSYDMNDNGLAYLLAIPSGRKGYVTEKYLFLLIFVTLCTAAGMIATAILNAVSPGIMDNVTFLFSATAVWAGCLVGGGIMMTIQLKFGAEKMRTVMLLVAVVCFAVGVGLPKMLPENNAINNAFARFEIAVQNSPMILCGAVVLVGAVLWGVFFGLSMLIINKKEY